MRILLSGYHNPRFPTITEYVEEAIVELGHELVRFDNRRFLVPGRVRRRVPWLEAVDLRRINRELLRIAETSKPGLFLETGGHRILPGSVDRLRAMGVTTALWTIDVPRDFEPVQRAAPHYDTVACGGTEAVELLAGRGVDAHWLPFACSGTRHGRVPALSAEDRERYGADVAFVGSHYPNRHRMLEGLASFDLGVWGPGWSRLPRSDPLHGRVRGDGVAPEQWLRIYRASKIVVVVHYRDGATPSHQASPKLYETLACGAFALVDDQKDVFSLFEDGTHLVRFRDAADLALKVEEYLERPAERSRIARAGRREVLAHHTYRDRVHKLLTLLPA